MTCHCVEGWICEAHPDRGWPHEDCLGPGMNCRNPDCPWWIGTKPAALSPPEWTDVVTTEGARKDEKPS